MKGSQLEEQFKFRFPKEALDEVREYVDLNSVAYRSYIDFCIEAIRMRLHDIHEEMKEKEKEKMKHPVVLSRVHDIRKRLHELAIKAKNDYLEETRDMLKKIK
jgi:hypothetical protein